MKTGKPKHSHPLVLAIALAFFAQAVPASALTYDSLDDAHREDMKCMSVLDYVTERHRASIAKPRSLDHERILKETLARFEGRYDDSPELREDRKNHSERFEFNSFITLQNLIADCKALTVTENWRQR